MTPQFVDLDGDGHKDMLMGTYTGYAWIVKGKEGGYLKPEPLLDENEKRVLVSLYYDKEKEDFINVDRSPEGETHPQDHGTSLATVDWDNDGDQDLLLGSYEGRMFLRENLGSSMGYRFAATNKIILAGDKPLQVLGGMTSPRVVDWDGDGLFDLIAGGVEGGAYFFKNVGKTGSPKFSKRQVLIPALKSDASEIGEVVVPSKNGKPLSPGRGWHIEAVDYDKDGDLDLLVGGGSIWFSGPTKKFTKADLAIKAKLQKKLNPLQKKMDKFLQGVDSQEAYEKISETKEFQALDEQVMKLYDKLDKYSDYPDEEAEYIWLYRRK